MIITVSISQFRQNVSTYLARAQRGDRIIIKDEKKGQQVAEVIGKKKFDMESFRKTLNRVAGTFTAQNHPEWKTKKDVIRWVERGRKEADRTF